MIHSIIFGILILYLQIFKAGDLSFWGITPNFLIAFAAYIGAYQKEKWALPVVFFLSIGYDLMSPETLGMNTLLLLIICRITKFLRKHIMEPKVPTVSILSLIYNFFFYLIFGMFYSLQTENSGFLFWIFLISVVVNSLISIIIFYVLLLLRHLRIKIE